MMQNQKNEDRSVRSQPMCVASNRPPYELRHSRDAGVGLGRLSVAGGSVVVNAEGERMRARLRMIAVGAWVALAAGAAGSTTMATAAKTKELKADPNGILRLATNTAPGQQDVHKITSAALGHQWVGPFYDKLLDFDNQFNIVPMLA